MAGAALPHSKSRMITFAAAFGIAVITVVALRIELWRIVPWFFGTNPGELANVHDDQRSYVQAFVRSRDDLFLWSGILFGLASFFSSALIIHKYRGGLPTATKAHVWCAAWPAPLLPFIGQISVYCLCLIPIAMFATVPATGRMIRKAGRESDWWVLPANAFWGLLFFFFFAAIILVFADD